MAKPLISVVASCFNEERNLPELAARLRAVFAALPGYDFEVLWLDNGSTDGTAEAARAECAADPRWRLIVNARNFGPSRSVAHGLLLARGEAVVLIASDLEDPPELIGEMLRLWRAGSEIVAGTYRNAANAGWVLRAGRRLFYWALAKFSDAEPIGSFTGFGLYSRRAVEIVRSMGDPQPYLRGIVSEIGLPVALLPFDKPARRFGTSSSGFLSLVDMAVSGFVSMSRAPVRMATVFGGLFSGAAFLLAVGFLLAKLFFWESFAMGQAPLLIGLFFFSSVQLLFLGLIGEYVAAIHSKGQNRPLVVERERAGFPLPPPAEPRAAPDATSAPAAPAGTDRPHP